MTAKLPKISYPVPSNKNGHAFSSAEELLSTLGGESSGLYLVGSQGMWHGGIHITDATIPWCALSTDSEAENEYCRELYKGEQFIRCMADGEIVAWRVSKDYESAAIEWRGEKLFLSTSFVLVKLNAGMSGISMDLISRFPAKEIPLPNLTESIQVSEKKEKLSIPKEPKKRVRKEKSKVKSVKIK